jgi:hypothetical protein
MSVPVTARAGVVVASITIWITFCCDALRKKTGSFVRQSTTRVRERTTSTETNERRRRRRRERTIDANERTIDANGER